MDAIDTKNIPDLVSRALTFHQAGRLADAEALYKRVLDADPRHFEALHFLGMVEAQRQNFVEADRLMSRSLEINARTADAYVNHARVLSALKRPEEALASCEKALAINPGQVSALVGRGNALQDLERFELALDSYDKALAINADNASAWANRGTTLWKLQRRDEAITGYQNALALAPQLIEALIGYGNALRELDRYEEALANYDKVLAVRPDNIAVLVSRAQVLGLMRRIDDAIACCNKALALNPDDVPALITRGDALTVLHRPVEALLDYDRALAITPDNASALNNRTNALQGVNRYHEALADLARAQSLAPGYADAHLNEALVRFCLGDFRRASEKYEWRWKCKHWPEKLRAFDQPLWLGQEPLQGRSILLHAEQGLGDTLHFMRYASLVAERGATVVLEVQPMLKVLASQMKGVSSVIGRGEPLPACDFHCPLLSLPLAFGTELDTVPKNVPYLWAPPDRMEKWQARLPPRGAPRIGLAWSGNPGNSNDGIRSMSLAQLAPLFELADIEFVVVQKDMRNHDAETLGQWPQIINLAPDLNDFGDTAAAISLLDLVIAVDTAVAHLVGGLGKPVWVPLPFSPGWRWMLDRNDSPWYPTARLFRQPTMGDWDSVVRQLRQGLQSLSEKAHAGNAGM